MKILYLLVILSGVFVVNSRANTPSGVDAGANVPIEEEIYRKHIDPALIFGAFSQVCAAIGNAVGGESQAQQEKQAIMQVFSTAFALAGALASRDNEEEEKTKEFMATNLDEIVCCFDDLAAAVDAELTYNEECRRILSQLMAYEVSPSAQRLPDFLRVATDDELTCVLVGASAIMIDSLVKACDEVRSCAQGGLVDGKFLAWIVQTYNASAPQKLQVNRDALLMGSREKAASELHKIATFFGLEKTSTSDAVSIDENDDAFIDLICEHLFAFCAYHIEAAMMRMHHDLLQIKQDAKGGSWHDTWPEQMGA